MSLSANVLKLKTPWSSVPRLVSSCLVLGPRWYIFCSDRRSPILCWCASELLCCFIAFLSITGCCAAPSANAVVSDNGRQQSSVQWGRSSTVESLCCWLQRRQRKAVCLWGSQCDIPPLRLEVLQWGCNSFPMQWDKDRFIAASAVRHCLKPQSQQLINGNQFQT